MNKIIVAAVTLLSLCIAIVSISYYNVGSEAMVVEMSQASDVSEINKLPDKVISMDIKKKNKQNEKKKEDQSKPEVTAIPALTSSDHLPEPKITEKPDVTDSSDETDSLDDIDDIDNEDDQSNIDSDIPDDEQDVVDDMDHSGIYWSSIKMDGSTYTVKWDCENTNVKMYQVQISNRKSFTGYGQQSIYVDEPKVVIINVSDALDYYVRVRSINKDGTKGAYTKGINIKSPDFVN